MLFLQRWWFTGQVVGRGYNVLSLDTDMHLGVNPLAMVPANKSVLAFNLSFLFDQKELLTGAMAELLGWVHSGQLKMPKVTEYKLDDVRKAHAALESGKTVGKLVLIPP